jgi:hypothetical protein
MYKTLRLPLTIFISVILCGIACTKTSLDKLLEEQNGGSGNIICDTVNMEYTADIVPILEAHCYSCHGNGNTGGSGGINLDGYNNIKAWIDNGYVLGNIRHDPGFIAMPYQMAKLDSCTINKVEDWINQGAPNN